MRWHYDLTGAEPIIRDCPVYDASSLAEGELLMLGTSANNTADGGISLVTAGTGTASTDATNAVGILAENTYASTAPSRTVDHTSGVYLGKVIINPCAVYLAEYDNDTDHDIAVGSSSTSTRIYATLSTIGANGLDGYWVLFVNCATSAIEGDLRMITENTTTYFTIPALSATPTTSDNYIFANPKHSNAVRLVSGDARYLDCTPTLDAPEGATKLKVVCSYVCSPQVPLTPLLSYVSPGQINVGKNGKLLADLAMVDHLFV
jgi:hypothetical protein